MSCHHYANFVATFGRSRVHHDTIDNPGELVLRLLLLPGQLGDLDIAIHIMFLGNLGQGYIDISDIDILQHLEDIRDHVPHLVIAKLGDLYPPYSVGEGERHVFYFLLG